MIEGQGRARREARHRGPLGSGVDQKTVLMSRFTDHGVRTAETEGAVGLDSGPRLSAPRRVED
jgi:hypothetical protein